MPASYVKKLAKEQGISEKDAEKKWNEAKAIVKEKYNEENDQFWGLVTHIFKKKMGLKEGLSFEEYIKINKLF